MSFSRFASSLWNSFAKKYLKMLGEKSNSTSESKFEILELFVIDHIIDLINQFTLYDEKNILTKLREKKEFYLNMKVDYENFLSS